MSSRRLTALAFAATLGALAPQPLPAQESVQQELRESQQRLEQIRAERARLQQQMEQLQSQVHSAAQELSSVERLVATSAEALKELEFQTTTLNSRIDEVTRELLLTRDQLNERRAVLRLRLRSIYKRGPLHTVQVLLTADTFGDLLSRYKYLHLVALYDRMLVREVTRLERDLLVRDEELRRNIAMLQRLRDEKLEEFAQLQYVESQHQGTLQRYRQQAQSAQGRLEQLARDEARLATVIEDLERKRLEAERRRAVAGGPAGASSLSTDDMGRLAWPATGSILYSFGTEQWPNGVTLRRNGIGIGAAVGTPVKAVEAGSVVMAGPFEGYGPSVILSHGGGFYTLYHFLDGVRVREGQTVQAGQVLGAVGGVGTPEGPHLEFQVRAPVGGGVPQPVDPLTWLRERAGP